MRTSATLSLHPDVAAGVHRLVHAATNCYLVEEAGSKRVTLIDAGLPGTWSRLVAAIDWLGRDLTDISDVILTHGHFDHLGMAARLNRTVGATVWVHPADLPIARKPLTYRPSRPRVLYPLRYPRSVPLLASMVGAGALVTPGVEAPRTLEERAGPPVAGAPMIIHTPGHTDGHCAVMLADRSVIFTGDALVTLDPYTGRTGPRVVARAGTIDPTVAADSLVAIGTSGARTVLPGHGDPWTGGAAGAAAAAEACFPLP